MPEIDKVGIAWGVLFSVVVNGIFLAILSLLHLNFQGLLASLATIITLIIVMIAFRNLLLPKSKEEKNKPKSVIPEPKKLIRIKSESK